MANFRKSFNFRSGVQVDDSNLVVDTLGKVGIGTSVPTELLDVRGTTKVSGLVTANNISSPYLTISGISTLSDVRIGNISLKSGIVTAITGIVTYYGDGSRLSNLPVSQWIDANTGLGYSSIYAAGTVGIATNMPYYFLQIGGTPDTQPGIGINSTGDIKATGIITASSFVGSGLGITGINASNISSGTLSASRFPSNINLTGIITASSFVGNITGNLTGTASTASSLTGTPNITVGEITANKLTISNGTISSNSVIINTNLSVGTTASVGTELTVGTNLSVGTTASVGTALTVGTNLTVGAKLGVGAGVTIGSDLFIGSNGTTFSVLSNGNVGIGTSIPTSDFQIRKNNDVLLEVITNKQQSSISIGQSVGVGKSTGVLRFGSSAKTFDIINNDTGNINMYLHNGPVGINTGRFSWIYGQDNKELLSLTYRGRLGIGITNPTTNLHVVGTSTVTGKSYFADDVDIKGTLTVTSFQLPSVILDTNLNTTIGISTFLNLNVTSVATATTFFTSKIGINTDIIASGIDIDAQNASLSIAKVGVGTDKILSFADPNDPEGQITPPLQVINGLLINDGNLMVGIDTNIINAVGLNTSIPKSVIDFSNVGVAATIGGYFIPPSITTADRNKNKDLIGTGTTAEGAIIYNKTTKKHQGYGSNDGGVTFNWFDLY